MILGLVLAGASEGRAGLLFFEDFSDNSAGWTLGATWEIGPAATSAGQSYGGPDPVSDHTPTGDNGVAGVVIGGNAPTDLHDFYYYLTSPVVDTSGAGSVTLDFYRWLNSDYTPYMKNNVEAFDGSTWVTIWETGSSPGIQDSAWSQLAFDVSGLANPAFQVRFGYNIGSSGVFTVSSWNVDDVSITGTSAVPEPASLGLLGLGLAGLAARRRTRRERRRSPGAPDASSTR